ncbi:hypothetical protein [Brevundimonas sp. LjRoot202]|uniref:hypothetical protein n=1 Tax=Brevundimonas sp. LjRoot202 TaxID=3342281 RepID=UPI003ECDCFB9
MIRAPEFQDTPTDREAVSLLLRAGGRSGVGSDDLAALNAAWDELAPRLAVMDEEAFGRWLADVGEAEVAGPVRERASDLTNQLIGWRAGDV